MRSDAYQAQLQDPLSPRYNSIEDAAADLAEGTRKRSVLTFERDERGLPRLTKAYMEAPIGVAIVWMGGDQFIGEILERKT